MYGRPCIGPRYGHPKDLHVARVLPRSARPHLGNRGQRVLEERHICSGPAGAHTEVGEEDLGDGVADRGREVVHAEGAILLRPRPPRRASAAGVGLTGSAPDCRRCLAHGRLARVGAHRSADSCAIVRLQRQPETAGQGREDRSRDRFASEVGRAGESAMGLPVLAAGAPLLSVCADGARDLRGGGLRVLAVVDRRLDSECLVGLCAVCRLALRRRRALHSFVPRCFRGHQLGEHLVPGGWRPEQCVRVLGEDCPGHARADLGGFLGGSILPELPDVSE
mmetsp:Transcript_100408/g.290008  ORF Transcript_100408/g.290008 Transcript_100408/m.290008 type:complete len:279 (+) Transcript_100408:3536-4372(+)